MKIPSYRYVNGTKVVPHQKTIGCTLEHSNVWKKAILNGRKYLYVTGFDEEHECYVLNNFYPCDYAGDFYNVCDFKFYKEEKKEEEASCENEVDYELEFKEALKEIKKLNTIIEALTYKIQKDNE